jgi:hypothetical protein
MLYIFTIVWLRCTIGDITIPKIEHIITNRSGVYSQAMSKAVEGLQQCEAISIRVDTKQED